MTDLNQDYTHVMTCEKNVSEINLDAEPIKDFRRRLDIYMKEFHREHNLINNRMTWYVTSQSFLMIALAASGQRANKLQFLVFIIPIVGLLITIFTFMSINAALSVQKTLKEKREKLTEYFFRCNANKNYNEYQKEIILEPWGIRGQGVQKNGMIAPKAIPIVMGVSWFVILVLIFISLIACDIAKNFFETYCH